MLQVASFALPGEIEKANEFLATHKPVGNVHFNTNMIVVFWDDGTFPAAYRIADLNELLLSTQTAQQQQEVALHILTAQLADLKHGSSEYNNIDDAIIKTKAAIENQILKAAFLHSKIMEISGTGPQPEPKTTKKRTSKRDEN